jgi:hypothetical protein
VAYVGPAKAERLGSARRLRGWLAVFCVAVSGGAAGQTVAEREAHQIAEDTLPQVLAYETILKEALERRDIKMFTEKFERPMVRLQAKWLSRSYRSRGITDEVIDRYSDCSMAVIDLLQYGRALLRDPNPDWASYMFRRYREDVANCRSRINDPAWSRS